MRPFALVRSCSKERWRTRRRTAPKFERAGICRLLVGNFGDGAISAYAARSGAFVGRMRTPDLKVLKIDGLWGIAFGNEILNQPTNTLFFAAGPNQEQNGLYGAITPAAGGWDDDRDDDN